MYSTATGRNQIVIFFKLINCIILDFLKAKNNNNNNNDVFGIRKTYSLCLSLYSSAAAAVAQVDASPAPRVFVALVSSSVPALAAALLPTAPVVAYTHINMNNKGMTTSKWLTITEKSWSSGFNIR